MAAEAEDGGEVVTTPPDDGEVHGAIADLERDAASANLSEQVAALEEECAQRAKAELALLAELQSRCDVHIAVQVRCDAAKSAASAAEREAEQLEAELTEVRSRADAALRFDDGDATARSLMEEVSAFEAHIASGAAEAGAHDAARVELQGEIATLRALVCALGGDDRHDEAAPEPPRAEPTAEMAAAALAVPARALHLLATDPCADETFDAVSTSVDVIEWQAHSILHGWSGMRSQMPPRLSRMRLGSVSASLAASAAESADAGDAGEESASAGDDLPSSGATPAAADANAFTWKRAAPTTFTDVLATRLVELDLVSPGPGSEWLSSWKTTPKPSAMGARAFASAGAVGGDVADARASGRATTSKNSGAIDDGGSESAAKQKVGDEPIEEPLDEEAWRYGESVEHILSELAREVRDGSPPVTRVMRRGLRCRLWTRSAALDPQRTPALGELAGAALEMHRRRAALTLIASELGERVLSMQASLAVAEVRESEHYRAIPARAHHVRPLSLYPRPRLRIGRGGNGHAARGRSRVNERARGRVRGESEGVEGGPRRTGERIENRARPRHLDVARGRRCTP